MSRVQETEADELGLEIMVQLHSVCATISSFVYLSGACLGKRSFVWSLSWQSPADVRLKNRHGFASALCITCQCRTYTTLCLQARACYDVRQATGESHTPYIIYHLYVLLLIYM
jgi:hypothetical protein